MNRNKVLVASESIGGKDMLYSIVLMIQKLFCTLKNLWRVDLMSRYK